MVRAIQAVSLGVVVFVGCAWLARRLAPLMSENASLAGQVALKVLLIAASLALWACTRRTWAEMGWKQPRRGIAEEIFVRGLIQSWITAPSSQQPAGNAQRVAVPVSAAFFAGMHVPLIWMGAGAVGGGIIVAATLVVGWAAAELRARTDSLAHAIGVHIFGNVAAVPFGILAVIAFRLTYGEMPFAK